MSSCRDHKAASEDVTAAGPLCSAFMICLSSEKVFGKGSFKGRVRRAFRWGLQQVHICFPQLGFVCLGHHRNLSWKLTCPGEQQPLSSQRLTSASPHHIFTLPSCLLSLIIRGSTVPPAFLLHHSLHVPDTSPASANMVLVLCFLHS